VNLELFDQKPAWRAQLANRLHDLAAQGIFLGTSSWKYEGWLGSIYTPQRYETRGKFSKKKFDDSCLAEYAEVFPAVGGDFSFYQFPSEAYWHRLFSSAPHTLQFGMKAPEMVTVRKWPGHARYGDRGGKENGMFLDAELLDRAFLRPLAPYSKQVGVIMFEFGTLAKSQYESVGPFARDLDRFLGALPAGFRYAVEIRNREYLDEPYFSTLKKHNVAHVFNAWTRMPELSRQIEIAPAFTADFIVSRALLAFGRAYEQAVERFQPYQAIQEPNPGARNALRELIERARTNKQLAFLFVNNRLEGNAPGTIQAVVDRTD
jgi:uncharacterized protein YecE (DUF72 family)